MNTSNLAVRVVLPIFFGSLAILPLFSQSPEAIPPAANAIPDRTMFSEAENVMPLEHRSRRKWDNALIADLDQDGLLDVVLTEHSQQAIIFWNDGGKFSQPQTLITGDTHGVAAGDYDQDGRMDLIIYHGGGGGKKPKNPVAFHFNKRSIEGGEEFEHFERSRGRAAKLIDADNNGSLDLVLSAFPLQSQNEEGANQVFRNAGKGEFEFVTKLPPAKWMGFRTLVTDFNNDADSDLIFYGGADMIALRGGEGITFSNATTEALGDLANTTFVSSISEIDYDNDGDFDLFLTRADHPFQEDISYDAGNSRFAYYVFASFTDDVKFQYDLKIEGDFRMENLQMAYPDFDVFVGAGKRKLEFKTDRHGGQDFVLKPEEAEGWPSDTSENGLNIGYLGDGMWRVGGETKSATSGVILNVKTAPPATEQKKLPAMLWENRDGVFVDVTEKMGLSIPEQTSSAAAGDFDNDGWVDLFIVPQGNPAMQNEGIMYLNKGGKSFVRAQNLGVVSGEVGATGGGAEAFDYDQDGDLDLLFGNERGRWHLFTNNGAGQGTRNWVVVKVGASPSKKAIAQGATLTLKAGGNIYQRVVGASSAAFSHSANNHLHVGLGDCSQVDEAVVRWSTGETESVRIDGVNSVSVAGHLD